MRGAPWIAMVVGVTSCSASAYQVVDPAGTLKVKAPMTVTIDGGARALTLADAVTLGTGVHTIQITRASNTQGFAIEVNIGQGTSRTPGTQPPPIGVLKSLSTASIQVDGKPSSLLTPQGSIELSAGTHTIEISPAIASSTHSLTLEIRPGTANLQNRGQ